LQTCSTGFDVVPDVQAEAAAESRFLSELVRHNGIRNRIMHPVRGYRPTRRDSDSVKDFAARMFAEDSTPELSVTAE
jgi:hypothetical protein